VRVIVMRVGVIGMSRCRCCHFQILPLQSSADLAVPSHLSVSMRSKLLAYCAAAPVDAKEFAGLVANFFFAPSTQAANS